MTKTSHGRIASVRAIGIWCLVAVSACMIGQPDKVGGSARGESRVVPYLGYVHRSAGARAEVTGSAALRLPGKKYLLAGTIQPCRPGLAPCPRVFLARFQTDGTLDQSFGNAGITELGLPVSGDASPLRLVLVDHGRVVVGATATSPTGFSDIALSRVTSSGRIDRSFGVSGMVRTDLGGNEILGDLFYSSDGIVAVGGTTGQSADRDLALMIARYQNDGALDPSFAGDGTATLKLPGGTGRTAEMGDRVVQDSQGRYVVGGSTQCSSFGGEGCVSGFLAARFLGGGGPDPEFGGDGIGALAFTRPPDLDLPFAEVTSVLLPRDGTILFGGTVGENNLLAGRPRRTGLARYTPDGQLDGRFGRGDGQVFGRCLEPQALRLRSNTITAAGLPTFCSDTFDRSGLLGRTARTPYPQSTLTSASLLPDGDGFLGAGTFIHDDVATGQHPSAALILFNEAGRPRGGLPSPVISTVPRVAQCRRRPVTILGGPTADRLVGTANADVVIAVAGNDRVDTFGGNDAVCAGPGRDTVSLGPGNDFALGGTGDDTLRGGTGQDLLFGGAGHDRLRK